MTQVRRTQITSRVDLGTAELVPDPRRRGGWILFIDGVAQSYVDLTDATHLEFAYVRRVAAVIDAVRPRRTPIDALHIGGGALSLARYVNATRPGSRQRVIERDAALWALVREHLPLPAGAEITVEIATGRRALQSAPGAAYDLIIADAFCGAQMPPNLTSTEFVDLIARALRPDGIYVVNVTDLPTLAFTRKQCATLRTRFADVCVVAATGMLRGRRFGNAVLVASGRAGGLPLRRIAVARAGETAPVGLVHGAELDAFIAGAEPVSDASAVDNAVDIGTDPAARAGHHGASE